MTFFTTKKQKRWKIYTRVKREVIRLSILLHGKIVSFITSKGDKVRRTPDAIATSWWSFDEVRRRNFTTKGRISGREGTFERNRNRLPNDKWQWSFDGTKWGIFKRRQEFWSKRIQEKIKFLFIYELAENYLIRYLQNWCKFALSRYSVKIIIIIINYLETYNWWTFHPLINGMNNYSTNYLLPFGSVRKLR